MRKSSLVVGGVYKVDQYLRTSAVKTDGGPWEETWEGTRCYNVYEIRGDLFWRGERFFLGVPVTDLPLSPWHESEMISSRLNWTAVTFNEQGVGFSDRGEFKWVIWSKSKARPKLAGADLIDEGTG